MLLEPLPGVPRQERAVDGLRREPHGRSPVVLGPRRAQPGTRDQDRARVIAFEISAHEPHRGESGRSASGAALVSGNFFEVLGVRAALGRTFRPEEDGTPSTHPVAVLAHRLLAGPLRRRSRDRRAETILLNGSRSPWSAWRPRASRAPSGARPDLWVPLAMQELVIPGGNWLDERGSRWLEGLVPLGPGVHRRAGPGGPRHGVAARLGRD